jgi:anaphase-promoting complex subunit 8
MTPSPPPPPPPPHPPSTPPPPPFHPNSLDRRQEAIKSYERAVITNDRENLATKKLAKLYREEGDVKKAADCYLRLIDNLGSSVDAGSAEALLFLAQYFKNIHNYENAALMCSRLLEYPGPEKEEAQALLRDIRSRRQAKS